MPEINYLIVAACVVVGTILGAVWYGPLFGNKWARLNGVDPNDAEAMKRMQEGMGLTMFIQIISTTCMVWVLYIYLKAAADEMGELSNALWIWAGFIVPTLVMTNLWSGESKQNQRTRFLIQAGFTLVSTALFGFIIGTWG